MECSKTVPLCVGGSGNFYLHHCPVCWEKARLAEWNCVDKCSGMNEPLLLCGAEVGEMNGGGM